MKRFLSVLILFTFVLAACSSPDSTTPTLAPSLTPRPSADLSQPATLFSGPGNINYENLAELPTGVAIYPTGSYGDYVQATWVQAGNETTGYIWKNAIRDIPDALPALDRLQVPWEPMYIPECVPGEYDPQTDSVTLTASESRGFYGTESAVWALETPVRIQLTKLTTSGYNTGGVKVLGVPEGSFEAGNWWKGIKAMSIQSRDGNYVLVVHDGTAENSIVSISLERSASLPIQILFDQPEGRSFAVLDGNNQELKHVDLTALPEVSLPDGLFPEKKFYFGLDTIGSTPLTVTGLSIGTQPDGKWVEPAEVRPGLAKLAQENELNMGALFDLDKMIDRRYCQVMRREFNLALVDEFTITSVPFWLGPGEYDYSYIDPMVEFAYQRGLKVFGSHLVWGDASAIPDWLRNGTFTRDEYINILEQHVKTVVGHYRGRVQEWSIANEYVDRLYWKQNHYPTASFHDFWYEKIGPEYVELSFQWARETDPDAILIFNAGGNSPPYNDSSQMVINMMVDTVHDLKARDVPIDGIGMQLHLLGPGGDLVPPQKAELLETMRKFADLGVGVYITELEVDIGSRLGAQDERYAFQAQVYRDVIDACLESGACRGFYTWGVSDSLSWITCTLPPPNCLDEPNGDPLLFDRDFIPKPAYYAVSDALAGIPSTTTPIAVEQGQELVTPPPPTLEPQAALTLYDDFENPSYNGAFDPAKWRRSGASATSQIIQQDSVLTMIDASNMNSGATDLVARAYDGIPLDVPTFIEANLAVAYDSAPGTVGIKITSSNPEGGTWIAGCGIERYSSRFRGNCSDFIWSQQISHSFETPSQEFELGSWHTVRVELDPASMTITYFIDGVVVGSHVIEDAVWLENARFQFSIGTWKSSIYYPLTGIISFVSIGQIER
jgi:endo-1,4-beta-xylanase